MRSNHHRPQVQTNVAFLILCRNAESINYLQIRFFFLISRILANHYRKHLCCQTELSCLLNTGKGKLFSINLSADRVYSLFWNSKNNYSFLIGEQACLCAIHNFLSFVFRRQQVTLLIPIDSSQWAWSARELFYCKSALALPFSSTKFPSEKHLFPTILDAPEHFLQVTSHCWAQTVCQQRDVAPAFPITFAAIRVTPGPRGEKLEFISMATLESSQGSQKIREWGGTGWNQQMRNKQNNVLMHCRRMDLWVMTLLKYLYLIMKTSLSSPVPKCCHGPSATPWKDLSSWQKF